MPTERDDYRESMGLSDDTDMVHLYAPSRKASQWKTEAEENGFSSRSRYLQALIAEARAYRQNEIRGPGQSERRIQELESELDNLRAELQHERQKSGGRPAIDDVEFLERFLSESFKPLSELLQDIVESGVLNDLVRKRVEDRLYFLAEQDRVAYERGWGWKLVDGGER